MIREEFQQCNAKYQQHMENLEQVCLLGHQLANMKLLS